MTAKTGIAPGGRVRALAPVFLPAALCATLAADLHAQAFVSRDRYLSSPATDICQAALPVYEGLIRKRPLAMTNEGTTTAFVTCSFTRITGDWVEDARQVTLHIRLGPDGATFTCTGVRSWETLSRSISGSPNGVGSLSWGGVHFAPSPNPETIWGNFNVSCAVPPGASILASQSVYTDWYELQE